MEIKFLAEEGTQPRASTGKKKGVCLALAAVTAVGVFAVYFGSHTDKPAPAYAAASSFRPVSSMALASSLSASSRSAVSGASSAAGATHQSEDWSLLLVNAKTKIPDSFTPQIVNYDGSSVQMDGRIKPYFVQMKAAAAKDGITLWLSGGYRSEDEQRQLFQQAVQSGISRGLSQNDAEQAARKTVAEPGYSEHNTGLALDFNGSRSDFVSTDAYAWLQQHAAEYGFILRYPQGKESVTGIGFQPWFYRYVGKDNAKKMNESKQCLEEFLKAP